MTRTPATPLARYVPALLAALTLAADAAAAQQRTKAPGAQLTELARVIGESHAIRQACQGPDDQYWRSRMKRLLDIEAPDEALSNRLSESFNAGYAAGRSMFPACSAAARQEGRRLAGRGQALAAGLAGP